MERKHGTRKIAHQHNVICIDRKLVMFLVAENISGVQYPVHVQKLIGGNCPPKIICESKRCVADKLVNGMSGEPTFECSHLASISNLASTSTKFILNRAS